MKKAFEKLFGRPFTHFGEAPGRVNLIGEHTDYNGGYVFPMAIPQITRVEMRRRDDARVRVGSTDVSSEQAGIEYRLGDERPQKNWGDYLKGTTALLRSLEQPIGGFEALISSQVPMGSGLSSSAALEVGLMRALRETFELSIDDVEIARLCQRVENEFVGARVGVMDPMACSLATAHTALFLDTQNLAYRQVEFPDDAALVVINSGIAHRNVGGGYNTRRAECEKACELLGVKLLRELTIEDLPRLSILPDDLKRRARHVISENDRVLQSVHAMEQGDLKTLGHLFDESHLSMKDDYEVSIPEIDMLVNITREQPGVLGARLTGGGFGGSIVALVKAGCEEDAAREASERYRRESGAEPTVIVPAR